jgi:hypothetical protein
MGTELVPSPFPFPLPWERARERVIADPVRVTFTVTQALNALNVLPAVELDGQLCFVAVEVENVRAERLLPLEALPSKTSPAELAPELKLRFRLGRSEMASEGGRFGAGLACDAHAELSVGGRRGCAKPSP